jgi:hypothetical protein
VKKSTKDQQRWIATKYETKSRIDLQITYFQIGIQHQTLSPLPAAIQVVRSSLKEAELISRSVLAQANKVNVATFHQPGEGLPAVASLTRTSSLLHYIPRKYIPWQDYLWSLGPNHPLSHWSESTLGSALRFGFASMTHI